MLRYKSGSPVSRQAFSVILDRKQNRTFEAVVDLKMERVLSLGEVKGVQPLVMESEFEALSPIVKADARWQAAMRKRGINNFDEVQDRRLGRRASRRQASRGAPDARPLLL